jgi:hypothetical protein
MKKYIFLLSLPLSMSLASCNDDYFDKNFDDETEYTSQDVVDMAYTLTVADYSAIASNATNKAIADSLDQLHDTTLYSAALAALSSQRYFTEYAPVDEYLPVFVLGKWPNADNGSKFNITYNLHQADYEYVDQLGTMATYTLSENDYETAWSGRGKSALYLTPVTVSKISSLLKEAYPEAAKGDIAMANYAYETTEPAAGSQIVKSYGNPYLFAEQEDGSFRKVSALQGAGNYIIAAYTSDGYVPFGFLEAGSESGYCVGNALSAPDGVISEDDAEIWIVTLEVASDTTYYIKNVDDKYLSTATSGGPYFLTDEKVAEGGAWQFAAQADGSFNLTSPLTGFYVKYSSSYSNYGMYAESKFANVTVTATNAALYQFNGTAWTRFTVDEATVYTFQPSDYTVFSSTATYVSSPSTQLPIWLSATYPYAEEGQRVAMAYKISSSKAEASVYEYTAEGWAKATSYTAETIVISRDNGVFTAKLSVYYNKALLGDPGDFTTQDITLDGLNYIWSNTNNYGWKASGFYQSANHTTESWLVSPAMNFKKAEAPYLVFDHVFRYLASGDAAEFNQRLGVFVSTDYAGDVTSCSWTQVPLTDESMPSNQDWTFVTTQPVDLSAFIGGYCWIAFRYTSSNDVDGYTASATWEVKNVLVREPETAE